MVICYTIKELNAIGETVILKELLARLQPDYVQPSGPQFVNYHQQYFQQQQQQSIDFNKSSHQLISNMELENQQSAAGQQDQLTSSVAEFFKKAQQNFYAQTNIDPTKVRRLSEVEAELIGGSRDSC